MDEGIRGYGPKLKVMDIFFANTLHRSAPHMRYSQNFLHCENICAYLQIYIMKKLPIQRD